MPGHVGMTRCILVQHYSS